MVKTALLICLLPCLLAGQRAGQLMGARSAGLAQSSVALQDVWSIYHNQAGMTALETTHIASCYQQRYFLYDLNLGSLALVQPLGKSRLGFSIDFFGFELYHETNFGLAYALALGDKISAGIKLNYHRLAIAESDFSSGRLISEAGLMLQALEKLRLGIHLYHPRAILTRTNNHQVPTSFRFGAACEISDQLMLAVELFNVLGKRESIRAGLEYDLATIITCRLGIATNPVRHSLGLGFNIDGLSLDLGFEYLAALGGTTTASLQYDF